MQYYLILAQLKKRFAKLLKILILTEFPWIPSHPIAGTEESGPKAGFANLFKDRWTIICHIRTQKKKMMKN